MLFGKDNTILSIIPHHRTDALYRIYDVDRYDYRRYITRKRFSPKPKNPKIASVFREIGLADELGSGMVKLVKYVKAYSGGVPKLIEGDVFKTEIPLNRVDTTQTITTQTTQIELNDTQKRILDLIMLNKNITRENLAEKIGITSDGIKYNLDVMKKKNVIKRVGNRNTGHWEIIK